MKKFFLSITTFVLICCSIVFVGCQENSILQCASFSEVTSSGSDDYAVRVNFYNDKRIEDKYVDIQIKSNKVADVTFWEDNGEKLVISFDDYDEWRSLTSLVYFAKVQEGEEKFEKFKDAPAKTFMFNFDGDIELTFRAVVGETEENSEQTGEILVGSQPISKQFTLKIK